MSPIVVGIIGLVALFVLLAFGFPIGAGMALVGFVGFWYLVGGDAALTKLANTPFSVISSYDVAVFPLFIFMAEIVAASGIMKSLYDLAARWLGRQPGGLAMATVGGCAGFAAVSASSIATAATMGRVAIPEMKRYKYDTALATGCVAAGGTMGILIPPSGALILYGIITETSIGQLFVGGAVPGVLEALFYIATISIMCRLKPSLGPRGPRYSLKEKIVAFGGCGEIVALVILVLGGLIIGWFTPTEAGAVGALGAVAFSLIRRRLDWPKFKQAAFNALKTSGMLYLILIGAMIFQYFMMVSNLPFWLSDVVSGLPLPPLVIMGVIVLVYIFLGCVLDASAMVLLTVPILFPFVTTMGFHPVWFGIIIVRMAEIAAITPPIGMNVFVIAGVVPDVPMQTIFKGIIPFLIADLLHVTMLMLVPAIVLFLPSLLY
jgi:tripartite ATP-independent transporter DctM subunit